ncbi:MAG TPA: hypothetical protein VGC94_01440 [Amnibacterium sp.]
MAEKMDVEARIAHFLRVSQDPGATQAERDTAGREAERLLAKHAIDRLTLDVDGARRATHEPIETGSITVQGGKGGVALDIVLGLARVAQTLGLVPYYSDRRSPEARVGDPDAAPHVLLSVTGFRSDVALALPLLESLRTQAHIAVRAWWRGDPAHRHIPRYDALLARCAFVQAFGTGAAERLRVARDEAVARTGTALVVASREAEVQDWVDTNVRLRSRRDRRSFSGYGRRQGYVSGLRSTGTARRAVPSGG